MFTYITINIEHASFFHSFLLEGKFESEIFKSGVHSSGNFSTSL